jgi:hypothetical protein
MDLHDVDQMDLSYLLIFGHHPDLARFEKLSRQPLLNDKPPVALGRMAATA